MPRARDEFDDEDYDGYRRRLPRGSGGGNRVTLPVILGMVVALVVGMGVLYLLRSQRSDQQAAERDRAAAMQFDLARSTVAREAPEPTWPRMVGVWTRTPGENETGGHPYRFKFRQDRTAETLRASSDREPIRQESTVEILSDQGNSVRLRLIVPMGLYGYTFTIQPDGALLLDDGNGGLLFQRDH